MSCWSPPPWQALRLAARSSAPDHRGLRAAATSTARRCCDSTTCPKFPTSGTTRQRVPTLDAGGKPADDPAVGLGPPPRRQEARLKPRSDTIILVRIDPGKGDRADVAAARPEGRDPRARHRQDQRRLHARRPEADDQDGQAAHRAARSTTTSTSSFQRLPRGRRTRSDASTSTSTAATSTTTPGSARPHYAGDQRQAGLPEDVRPARRSTTCATATPTTTSSAPRASRTSCARSRSQVGAGKLLRQDRKKLIDIFADNTASDIHVDRRPAAPAGLDARRRRASRSSR